MLHTHLLRTISLATFSLAATACIDDAPEDFEDPELSTSEAELNVPGPLSTHQQISSMNGGGCVDLPLGLPAGSVLFAQQHPCNSGSNQRFRFEEVGTNVFRIHSAFDVGKCLDLPSSNTGSGQDVQFFPCHGGNNQLWLVSPTNSTSAVIKPILHLGRCLDVEGGVANGTARLQIFTCHGGSNQSWRFRTWVGTDSSVRGCNGNIRFGAGGPIASPGVSTSFAVSSGNVETLCSDSLPFPRDTVGCPSSTRWMVADRRAGTGSYPVACFQQ